MLLNMASLSLTCMTRTQVYIIGGIVDRNRLKGITYKKAQEQGIETGKLPLDQVVNMGGATRVLTVNHGTFCVMRCHGDHIRRSSTALAHTHERRRCLPVVFEILIQYAERRDWATAALATLPSRKNVQLKQEE